jgi:hypothetical protein
MCCVPLQNGASKQKGQVLVQEHVPKVKVWSAAALLVNTQRMRCSLVVDGCCILPVFLLRVTGAHQT